MDKVFICSMSFCPYIDDAYYQGGYTFKCSDCPKSEITTKEDLAEWLNHVYGTGGDKDGRI